jgi:hypothetical protein
VLFSEKAACFVCRAVENKRAGQPVYAPDGFEDPDQADVIDPHTHVRIVFGLLSPGSETAPRSGEVRVAPSNSGSRRAPASTVEHGAYAIVLTRFDHSDGLTPQLQALDDHGHIVGSTG